MLFTVFLLVTGVVNTYMLIGMAIYLKAIHKDIAVIRYIADAKWSRK
jgi:hypothetical protein